MTTRRGFLASLAGLIAAPTLRLTTELGMLAGGPPKPSMGWDQLIDTIFREYYMPGIREQLNEKRIMARLFEKSKPDLTRGTITIDLKKPRESFLDVMEREVRESAQVLPRGLREMCE